MRRRTPDNQTNKWYKLHIVWFNLLKSNFKNPKIMNIKKFTYMIMPEVI